MMMKGYGGLYLPYRIFRGSANYNLFLSFIKSRRHQANPEYTLYIHVQTKVSWDGQPILWRRDGEAPTHEPAS